MKYMFRNGKYTNHFILNRPTAKLKNQNGNGI